MEEDEESEQNPQQARNYGIIPHGDTEQPQQYQNRVLEWEIGLPSSDDLMPLSQSLIPPELASAFSITPEPYRTILDVNRASQSTISAIRHPISPFPSTNNLKSLPPFESRLDPDGEDTVNSTKDGADSRKGRRSVEITEEADSALHAESSDDAAARTLKRPRLVWTPQLHKRFVDVVAHLGIKNAVPKTIMNLMNVEGLTRENVASHLQKYRLYLKRMNGSSDGGGPSSSADHQLFASTPVPQSLHEPGPIPMPYGPPLMPMPVLGMAANGHGHVPGMPISGPGGGLPYHSGCSTGRGPGSLRSGPDNLSRLHAPLDGGLINLWPQMRSLWVKTIILTIPIGVLLHNFLPITFVAYFILFLKDEIILTGRGLCWGQKWIGD